MVFKMLNIFILYLAKKVLVIYHISGHLLYTTGMLAYILRKKLNRVDIITGKRQRGKPRKLWLDELDSHCKDWSKIDNDRWKSEQEVFVLTVEKP